MRDAFLKKEKYRSNKFKSITNNEMESLLMNKPMDHIDENRHRLNLLKHSEIFQKMQITTIDNHNKRCFNQENNEDKDWDKDIDEEQGNLNEG